MAKKFCFTLRSLLKLRSYTAEIKKSALAEILRLREEQERLIQEKQHYLDLITNIGYERTVAAGAMQSAHSHRESVKNEITSLFQKQKQLAEIEQLRRKEYSEALKEVKVLEKLKEQQKERYRIEINREEQQFLDEIAQHSVGAR